MKQLSRRLSCCGATLLVGLLFASCDGEPGQEELPLSAAEFRDRHGPQSGNSGFVELVVDGTRLKVHHHITGSGPDLLLLHGICDSLHTWDGWVEKLRDDFRLVRVDYPPFGLTGSFPDGDYSEERMFEFLDEFLDAVGVRRPCFVAGNSLGAGIAWRYEGANPGQFRRMVLIDPAGFVDEKEDLPKAIRWADSGIAASRMRQKMPRSLWERTIRELYGDAEVSEETLDREVTRFHDLSRLPGQCEDYVTVFQQALALAEADSDEAIAAKVGRIRVPVLILWGEADPWFPPHADPPAQGHLEKWKKALATPHEIRLYPGVGHMPQLQIPERTAADARAFLLAPARS